MTRDQLLKAAQGFDVDVAALDKVLLPTIHLVPKTNVASRSQLGGLPLLPRDFAWPSWSPEEYCDIEIAYEERKLATAPPHRERDKHSREHIQEMEALKKRGPVPFDFMAQLDLADLAGLDAGLALPRSGMLSFFVSSLRGAACMGRALKDRPYRVFHFTDDALVKAARPKGLEPWIEETHGLAAKQTLTLPEAILLVGGKEPVQWFEDERVMNFQEFLSKQGHRGIHQVGGAAEEVQSDQRSSVELLARGFDPWNRPSRAIVAEAEAHAGDWVLLLQLHDRGGGVDWDGVGTFWIRRKDLANGRFDRAHFAWDTT